MEAYGYVQVRLTSGGNTLGREPARSGTLQVSSPATGVRSGQKGLSGRPPYEAPLPLQRFLLRPGDLSLSLLHTCRPIRRSFPFAESPPNAVGYCRRAKATTTVELGFSPTCFGPQLLLCAMGGRPMPTVSDLHCHARHHSGLCPRGGAFGHWRLGAVIGVYEDAATEFVVSFDGGARRDAELDARVAGAGAILWRTSPLGVAQEVGRAQVALPSEAWSPIAEAWGLRLALHLACRHVEAGHSLRVVGDNVAVVRFGAAQGRLRNPDHEALISPVLCEALVRGVRLSWAAVRRRYNRAADAVATEGVRWAARLARVGEAARRVRFLRPHLPGHSPTDHTT